MRSRRHKWRILAAVSLVVTLFAGVSCNKKLPLTTIMVQDSIRHYYPLVQGTDLIMLWRIANTGETPLVLSDIQPSCGCLVTNSDDKIVVPPGKDALLEFVYHSNANSGYVRHTIRLYGNIVPQGMASLVFDLNVVVPALGSPDYEEQHKDRNEYDVMTGVKNLVDGYENQRGYWTDENDYSRGYNKYYWRKGRK